VKKRKKKSELAKTKENAWKAFSAYIRFIAADYNGRAKCVTCGAEDNAKKMQAGHFVDGRTNLLLYNEAIVHVQCFRCNVLLKGNKVAYTLFMLKKGYTSEQLEEFENLKFKTQTMLQHEHKAVYEKYKFYIEELRLLTEEL